MKLQIQLVVIYTPICIAEIEVAAGKTLISSVPCGVLAIILESAKSRATSSTPLGINPYNAK